MEDMQTELTTNIDTIVRAELKRMAEQLGENQALAEVTMAVLDALRCEEGLSDSGRQTVNNLLSQYNSMIKQRRILNGS